MQRVISLIVSMTVALLSPILASAQAARVAPTADGAKPAKTWTAPRTPWGEPDLQGTFSNRTITPFERPANVAGREFFTAEEVAAMEKRAQQQSGDEGRSKGTRGDVERAYNDFWWDFGTRVSKQSSLVVDPADGRVPALTDAAQTRAAERRNRFDNPEERPLPERCILGFNSGPPMVPSAYNNNVQIVQTGHHIVIVNEMIHSARIIDLSRRAHWPKSMRFLTGDSIAQWEGDTLVVDTTNYAKDGVFRGSTADLHLVERFTRVDSETLRYEFTVDDPSTWTKKWSASITMARTDQPVFEYACHEGNYALEGVLKGARYQDKHPQTQKH